jgi:hypothetical protein
VANFDVPLKIAARRRAKGYLVTDAETPLIREWVSFIERKFGTDPNDIIDPNQYTAVQIAKNGWAPFPQLSHDDPKVSGIIDMLLPEWRIAVNQLVTDCIVPLPYSTDGMFDFSALFNGNIVGPPPCNKPQLNKKINIEPSTLESSKTKVNNQAKSNINRTPSKPLKSNNATTESKRRAASRKKTTKEPGTTISSSSDEGNTVRRPSISPDHGAGTASPPS